MLFKHTSIYILAKAIPGVMAFAALSLYTHVLTPDEYGLYTLIFTASIFLHNVIFNWLPAGTLRYWSKSEFSASAFISILIKTYLSLFLFLLFILAFTFLFFWGEPIVEWTFAGFCLIVSFSIFTLSQTLMSAQIEPLKFAKLGVSYSILALLFGGFMAYRGFGALGVILGISLGFLVPTLFVKIDFWKYKQKLSFNKSLFKQIALYGLPLASVTLLEEVTKSADRFMLAVLQDKAQAGMYAVGYDLSGNSILLLMSAINLAAYPVIIKLLDTEGKDASMAYFHKYAVLLIGIAIPAVLGLILVGPNLVHLLIGEEYQQAVIFLLPWITIALFMMGMQATYFDLAFQLGHYTIGIVKISIVVALLNVILNFYLIPKIGMKGAAIATLSSFIIGAVLSAILGRKHFSLPFPIRDFMKIAIATAFMALLLWLIKDNRGWVWLLIQLLLGIISYAVMVLGFNLLDMRENIKTYLKKSDA